MSLLLMSSASRIKAIQKRKETNPKDYGTCKGCRHQGNCDYLYTCKRSQFQKKNEKIVDKFEFQ